MSGKRKIQTLQPAGALPAHAAVMTLRRVLYSTPLREVAQPYALPWRLDASQLALTFRSHTLMSWCRSALATCKCSSHYSPRSFLAV